MRPNLYLKTGCIWSLISSRNKGMLIREIRMRYVSLALLRRFRPALIPNLVSISTKAKHSNLVKHSVHNRIVPS